MNMFRIGLITVVLAGSTSCIFVKSPVSLESPTGKENPKIETLTPPSGNTCVRMEEIAFDPIPTIPNMTRAQAANRTVANRIMVADMKRMRAYAKAQQLRTLDAIQRQWNSCK